MKIVLLEKYEDVFGENCSLLGGLLFPDGCYVITDYNALTERVRMLPLTNRNARVFTKYVLENIEELEYHENEIIIPTEKQEFFATIDLKVVKVERSFEKMKLLYIFDENNIKLQEKLELEQEAGILTYQVLEAKLLN